MRSMYCVTLLSALVLVAMSGVAWAITLCPDSFDGCPPPSVPEPTTLALLAAGIGGVAWAKFRRRK